MVHYTATLWSTFVRLIHSIASMKGFRIFSHYFNQAYVQNKDNLTRQSFIFPKKEDLKILGIK